jgi:mono/diheme cytochrome c family protein
LNEERPDIMMSGLFFSGLWFGVFQLAAHSQRARICRPPFARGAVMKRFAAAFVLLLLLAVFAVMGVAYSGFYDFGADAPHWASVEHFIALARNRAVAARARAVVVPPFTSAMLADGASDYDAMCSQCHLAPGMADNEMRPGLYPAPPAYDRFASLTAGEEFWVIKHGIKMSAMPAWGRTHSDAEIWNMVAFLQKLPALTPAGYKAATKLAEGHHAMDQMDMEHH